MSSRADFSPVITSEAEPLGLFSCSWPRATRNYFTHSRPCFRISSRVTPRISEARPRKRAAPPGLVRTRRDSRSSTKSYSERPAGSPDRRQSHANSLSSSASGSSMRRTAPDRLAEAFAVLVLEGAPDGRCFATCLHQPVQHGHVAHAEHPLDLRGPSSEGRRRGTSSESNRRILRTLLQPEVWRVRIPVASRVSDSPYHSYDRVFTPTRSRTTRPLLAHSESPKRRRSRYSNRVPDTKTG